MTIDATVRRLLYAGTVREDVEWVLEQLNDMDAHIKMLESAIERIENQIVDIYV